MKTKLFFAAVAVAFTACVSFGAERVRYVERQVQECFVDANGNQRCRMATKTFAVTESVPDSAPASASAPCPCVAATGSCPCAASAAVASAPQSATDVTYVAGRAESRFVFFPRVRAFFEDVREQRQERVQNRRAFLFGAYYK